MHPGVLHVEVSWRSVSYTSIDIKALPHSEYTHYLRRVVGWTPASTSVVRFSSFVQYISAVFVKHGAAKEKSIGRKFEYLGRG